MVRRLFYVCVLALVVAAPAAGDLSTRKSSIDARLSDLHSRIAVARARENRLTRQIGDVTGQIRSLEGQVGDVSTKLQTLQRDLDLHRQRLAKLTQLFTLQTRRFDYLRSEYRAAVQRLAQRLVEIYESDDPTTIGVILSASSFQDILDQVDYYGQIAHQDKRIAGEVGQAKHEVKVARAHTNRMRLNVASETQVIAVRTQQQKQLQTRLLISQHSLSGAKQRKLRQLAATQESEKSFVGEADALASASASIASRIQAAEASAQAAQPAPPAPAGSGGNSSGPSDSTPSSHGLIWPVSGPVTSPFGWRWGRMHEGIDIGVPSGTPIHAAASGRVIYAGWESGYGNLTVIDHGSGLATAYGHQSSIGVRVGESVGQGQYIGAVGCTGHCTGPHLHFEVRINGRPVDPLGYL